MAENPAPEPTALTWRIAAATSTAGEAQLRARLVTGAAGGWLLGYYAMHNQWLQAGWVLLCSAWLLALSEGRAQLAEAWRRDRWMQAVAAWLALGVARSSLVESPGMTPQSFGLGWAGALLLVLVLSLLWQAARQPRAPSWMGAAVVLAGTLTAGGSMAVFYAMSDGDPIGQPLKNWFIYGGWNTVCTGMTFGFAAVWASWVWQRSAAAGARWRRPAWMAAAAVLIFATLLTLSRGALLALTVAHLAWFLPRGWRAAWRPMLLLAACLACFQFTAPVLSWLAAEEVAVGLGVEAQAVHARIQDYGVIPPNPALRVVERGDNGRFAIYAGALGSMTTWQDWLLGKGLWSATDAWSCGLWWNPEHLHSVFLDTLVKGGAPALLGLLFLTGWGMRRAWRLAMRGEELWLLLASYGLAGMIFDGDSLSTAMSLPRFEPLLLWTPLVAASARDAIGNTNTAPEAPSEG